MTSWRPRITKPIALVAALSVATFVSALAGPGSFVEHVTGGDLDLPWLNGFGVSNNMQGATLDPGHPAYDNPSGDHTVAVATNSMPDSGGIILTCTDPHDVPRELAAGSP